MPQLFLTFTIHLERSDLSSSHPAHGPLFHRWLPDGEKNAIPLPTGTPNVAILAWFYRAGTVIGGFVEYQQGGSFDQKLISTQGILDAGHLCGRMVFKNVSNTDLDAIGGPIGNTAYVKFGKSLVKTLIPPLSTFVDTLRVKYGQYWLSPIPRWDSRRESLGAYCQTLQLRWSTDGTTWARFLPDQPVIHLVGSLTPPEFFLTFLTETDWNDIYDNPPHDYVPPLGASVLLRARELLDNENLRYAFIEAATAAEITVDQLIRDRTAPLQLPENISRVVELPLSTKLALLGVHEPALTNAEITDALKAIRLRNEIVHDGAEPKTDSLPALKALIKVTARLSSHIIKLPSAHVGNSRMSLSTWKREQAKREPPFLV